MTNLWTLTRLKLKSFWRNTDGTTALEYGLFAALISVVLIVGLDTVAASFVDMFTAASTALNDIINSGEASGTPESGN